MTHAEFLALVKTPRWKIYRAVRGQSIQALRTWLREIQQATAAYARAFPYDLNSQLEGVVLARRLERTLHKEFVRYQKEKIRKDNPFLSPVGQKVLIQEQWSRFYADTAY